MADTAKQKGNKFLFVCDEEEEGEISENEEVDEKEVRRKRDADFINDWAKKCKEQKLEHTEEIKSEMEIASDDEEKQIDVKPIAMTITFRDEQFAKKHRGVVETQLIMKFGPDKVDSNNTCIFIFPSKTSTEITEAVVVPSGAMSIIFHDVEFCNEFHVYMLNLCKQLFGASKVTSDKWLIEVVQNDLLDFDVDTSTEQIGNNYVKYFMPNNGVLPKDEPKNKCRPLAECFNCGGSHSLNQCKERRNFQVINENRELFRQRKAKGNIRYHAEKEKFSGLAPGHLTPVLRDALGLRSTQLPLYIYRMRKYGYPPGWLLEAKVAHSGVTVYGSKGAVPEEDDEEGEVFEEGEKDRYDIKKIVHYPGFNCDPPPSTEEEHEKLNCPPISAEHDVSDMIQRLAPNAYQAYKKRNSRIGAADSADSATPSSSTLDESEQQREIKNEPQEEPQSSDVVIPRTPEPAGRSLSVDFGTPILPSASPFGKLPDRDKFGVNISDVINFENLPNATGTYKKVAHSIAKIREFAAQNAD